jgi:two-component system response regulator HupR/HoxA
LLRNYFYGSALAYVGLAYLALDEGRVDEARTMYERAQRVVESRGGKPGEYRGKPGIDVRLLGARILFAEGKGSAALEEAVAVQECARAESERLIEARSLALQAEVLETLQRRDAAADCLVRGADLLERVGERIDLAGIRTLQARLELESGDDKVRLQGLQHLVEACDHYRAVDLPMKEAHVVLALAGEDIRQKALDRASDRLSRVQALRQRLSDGAGIDAEIQKVSSALESSLMRSAVVTQEGLEAHGQMERILRSSQRLDEKMIEFLRVLTETIPASAACVLSLSDLEARVVSSHGLPELRAGRTLKRPASLRSGNWPEDGRPLVFLNVADGRGVDLGPLAAGRSVSSAMAIPLGTKPKSGSMVLYVDRASGTATPLFQQAEIASCTSLARKLAGFLEEAGIRDRRGQRETPSLERNIALADIVTQNKGMLGILGLVGRIASSNLSVLLQGETGTGKKLIARAIHQCSARADGPFVTVDCAALAETVLESELFGHVKGSFTGAHQDRIGLIEQANGGTVFLDEIDKTNTAIQRHFLHLLDCGEIRPVGSHAYRSLDIRVVCATSAPDLRQEVEAGRFIKDLYFRLNDISISIPSLRERKDDIPLLAEYFHDMCAQTLGRTNGGVSQLAMRALTAYDWPGNVRELEKAIQAAVTMADDGETIGIDLLPSRIGDFEASEEDVLPVSTGDSLRDQLERVERQIIQRTLDELAWNKSRAAVALGLSRKGLKNKITRYRLDRRVS